MNLLEQEIENVLKTINIPDPVFELRTSGASIGIKKVGNISSNSDSPIKGEVLTSCKLHWDNQDCSFTIQPGRCVDSVRSLMTSDVVNFILRNSSSKNPRLTAIYQWYNSTLNILRLEQYPELENILFETWKYTKTGTEIDPNNVMNILEVIKCKFEKKGIKK